MSATVLFHVIRFVLIYWVVTSVVVIVDIQ